MQIKTIYINLMKTTRFTMSCANIIEVCTMQKFFRKDPKLQQIDALQN